MSQDSLPIEADLSTSSQPLASPQDAANTSTAKSAATSQTTATAVHPEATASAEKAANLRQEDPLMIVAYFAISLYLVKIWWDDFKRNDSGDPQPNGFPGATRCKPLAVWIAVIGALLLLGLETAGEYALGISAEQSDITRIFLLSMIAAAFIEELIFRGFLVCENRGKAALVGSIVGFSLLFALLHPHLWHLRFDEGIPAWQIWSGEFSLDFSLKAFFTTGILFVNSLWFYVARFNKWNPSHSLIPCFVAHLVKNVGVFIIKWAQGHVV